MSDKISSLGLSSRATNSLGRYGITSARKVAAMSDADLLDIRHLGVKQLAEIRAAIPYSPDPAAPLAWGQPVLADGKECWYVAPHHVCFWVDVPGEGRLKVRRVWTECGEVDLRPDPSDRQWIDATTGEPRTALRVVS